MDGYSVIKVQRPLDIERYHVFKDDVYVASISKSTLSGKMGFDWHNKDMWKFNARDFVIA